jgi:hypothetical protein
MALTSWQNANLSMSVQAGKSLMDDRERRGDW